MPTGINRIIINLLSMSGLKITAGQRTMSGLIEALTGQTFDFPVMLTGQNRTLSHSAETKDFARPTSHPVRDWMGKNKAFCSPGTQNGRRVIKVY